MILTLVIFHFTSNKFCTCLQGICSAACAFSYVLYPGQCIEVNLCDHNFYYAELPQHDIEPGLAG